MATTPAAIPPTPPPIPLPDRLTEGLRRWRALFVGACVLIGIVAIAGFLVERRLTNEVLHTGTILRAATATQQAAWEVEASLRRFTLRRDTTALEHGRMALRELRDSIISLRAQTGEHHEPLGGFHRIQEAASLWDTAHVARFFATGTSTVEEAMQRTAAFDALSDGFAAFYEEESAMRAERVDRQRLVRRISLAVLLIALLASLVAFSYLGRENERAADEAQHHRRRVEEQAGELEVQARQLIEQAETLEEQASELENRLEAEEATRRLLEKTASFLDAAVEGSPLGIAFFDTSLRYQRVNDALARLNGIQAAAHVGRTIEEIVPHIAPNLRAVLERVLATGQMETEVSVQGPHPDRPRELRHFVATFYPIVTSGSAAIGVGAIVQDVTERWALEEQLRQAQKMEAVGRLAGGVAHDFNNLLTVIQSYGELLGDDLPKGSKGSEELEAIRGAADRATALARQLLAFSRREVIVPRDIDVSEGVQRMEPILRRLLRQGIELKLDLHAGALVAHLDPGQFEQVLMNLAINAIDAMPDGGTLRITTERHDTPNAGSPAGGSAAALVSVHDTGTGMTSDVQQHLFEPFFTTKPAGEGTGLGLATTYAIVSEAGGTIVVDSTLGVGSRFDVRLPLSTAQAAQKPARISSPVRGTAATRTGETILLAEDEVAIRTALSRVLTANGYRVLEAPDGAHALGLAGEERGPIHLLLTDVMMPGMGGKELVQRLRQMRPETRVILMSGYTDDELLRAELGDARYVFLQKPFAAGQVIKRVRELLDA